jgi:starch synthase
MFNDNIYLVYKGSDFGLIPFLYDNWINLHHKYFASGTPVVAYEVGQLKDTVKEFNFNNKTGNGFLFDHFNPTEFYLAVKRTIDLYRNKTLLEICRKNCEESVVDTNEICIDLCRELYKLKNKIFFDTNKIYDDFLPNQKGKNCNYNDILDLYKNSTSEKDNVYREILYDSNHFIPDYSSFGKNVKRISSCKKCSKGNKYNNYYNSDLYTISYKLDYPQPKRVQITGSFDNWSTLKDLKYNRKTRKWEIDLNLRKGKYFYKFLIDNKTWKVNPFEHYQKELNGMVNNVLYIV